MLIILHPDNQTIYRVYFITFWTVFPKADRTSHPEDSPVSYGRKKSLKIFIYFCSKNFRTERHLQVHRFFIILHLLSIHHRIAISFERIPLLFFKSHPFEKLVDFKMGGVVRYKSVIAGFQTNCGPKSMDLRKDWILAGRSC